ncbi:MAG TPA: hypothetical protein DCZ92_01500 [Elusimicrobia bacterium]|nr:MAG: hypothetical protein A2016_12415 [Elusimicrobia bacterium GWF2_62_30]HBA59501.1 hypothetical protein [Elusimicrobiota bacterium]
MNLLLNVLVSTLAVLITAKLLKGVSVDGFYTAAAVSIVLGAVNSVLAPLLIALTLPLNVLTLGLCTFGITAVLVQLVAAMVPGFRVANFWWALGFGLILGIVNSALHAMAGG